MTVERTKYLAMGEQKVKDRRDEEKRFNEMKARAGDTLEEALEVVPKRLISHLLAEGRFVDAWATLEAEYYKLNQLPDMLECLVYESIF